VRRAANGDLVVWVAVPVQPYRQVMGAMLFETRAGDIESWVREDRIEIIEIFMFVLAVTIILSLLMAATIARPIRRLAEAALRLDPARARQVEIPDLANRRDEIGDLSVSLRAMTEALLRRIDAIESFAADVAHEIKNPLTSLRSAVETLARVTNEVQRERLLKVILDDVGRIDRLISDISSASRLDAELSRAISSPVDLGRLMETLCQVYTEMAASHGRHLTLDLDGGALGRDGLIIAEGLEGRLGQVMRNLIDNAISFSPPNGKVQLRAHRRAGSVELIVEDEGPGIPEESLTRIFERFYSERPEGESFGVHSGLGLSIARQIVEAHKGTIRAENLKDSEGRIKGARFIVSLPV
jgi:two-component system sensor histidine kinase ChvG